MLWNLSSSIGLVLMGEEKSIVLHRARATNETTNARIFQVYGATCYLAKLLYESQ
jgi:hypothetical protein